MVGRVNFPWWPFGSIEGNGQTSSDAVGYGAELANATQRRNTVLQLAREEASQLGRKISSLDIDPEALAGLKADGIICSVRPGLTVKIAHNLYFEWAFL